MWILWDHPHQHQHFIDEGTKTKRLLVLSLTLSPWTSNDAHQSCFTFLFFFRFLDPFCIFLIILHFGIQKDTRLKECNLSVDNLPIIFFYHPFYSASFSTHSTQLSLLYHFDHLDNFNMALSFSRGVKISIASGDVGNFTAEIFGFSVSTIKQYRKYPNQQNKSKLQNYTHIQITILIVGFFFS